MALPAWLELAKEWGTVAVPTCGAAWSVYRYVLRPKVLIPARAFYEDLCGAIVKVDAMALALGPNGGSSIADAIRRTERIAVLTDARVTGITDFIERPLFEASADGAYTRVNRALELTFGFSQAELVDRGWINMVRPEDRDRVVKEWRHAVGDRRAFNIQAHYQTRAGKQLAVVVRAEPAVHEDTGGVIGWLGGIDITEAVRA